MGSRKNPYIITSSDKDLPPVIDGIDNLPQPIGVNMDNLEKANMMIDAPMTANDGDQKTVAMPSFADGVDKRVADNRGGQNPWPAKPGC